ncbi:MAG: cytochrome-c peroxidase [Gammaproteobacteria bacterium]
MIHSVRLVGLCLFAAFPTWAESPPLGLPPVPIPVDNPQTAEKIQLGNLLFHDIRFSATGKVSCATCHNPAKTFTDSPLRVSQGINSKTGTRNAPTVVNAAYMSSQFWDGRAKTLEEQSLGPFVDPVEGGLTSHELILKIVRSDPSYVTAFQKVFGKSGAGITMQEVSQAIASFERSVIAGDSPFDRYYFAGDKSALSKAQIRGLQVFLSKGRCVSCHTIEQDHALFTDSKFHNIGVGINGIQPDIPQLVNAFLQAKKKSVDVDVAVLTNPKTSELGRFAVSGDLNEIGAFKTPTLRNAAQTAPYMHDGSMKTLRDVIVHYNNGGKAAANERVNDLLSSGIRPLGLTPDEIDDLNAFLQSLTSPQFAVKAAR